MVMRRASVVLAFAVVTFGCSSDHKATPPPPTTTTVTTPRIEVPPARNAQERAIQACAEVAPKDFVNAKATTVGAIHAITGPGNVHGYTWILKGSPSQSFAAWCWRKASADNYKGYIVGPNGEVVDTGQASSGAGPPTPGPLAVT